MSKFKVGDKVKVLYEGGIPQANVGDIVTITGTNTYGQITSIEDWGGQYFYGDSWYELINNNNSIIMNTIQKFKNLFIKEPQLSFRKAGITDNEDILTDDGQKIFLSWLLTQNADKFKTEIVDKLLQDDANNKQG